MENQKFINIREYKIILVFNDSEECYLFKTEEEAMQEGKRYLNLEECTEAYLFDISKINCCKLILELKKEVI